jgi:XTP/dITP diphosphohydrolase
MPTLLLGTTNPGKLRELRALFALPGLDLVLPDQLGLLLEVAETGASYLENAHRKAVAYAQSGMVWALGDDTGLEVDALFGGPGLRSARVGENDPHRRELLLASLAPHPRPWRARFRCALVLAGPQGSVDAAEGEVTGEIVPAARGQNGFGYDPIFLVDGAGKTMAELDDLEKNHTSHRARAAQRLLPTLKARLGLE